MWEILDWKDARGDNLFNSQKTKLKFSLHPKTDRMKEIEHTYN
jgi:hypothetical protein